MLCCLAGGGLASGSMQARPIEFSEPGSSNLTVNVSGLGAKPADLPSVANRVFRPHAYQNSAGLPTGMKPLANSFRQNNRVTRPPDRDKNALPQTPQQVLQSMMEGETHKLTAYGTENQRLDESSSWDPYNLQSARRSGTTKANARGLARETNRLDGATAALRANDPFASISGRRPSPDFPATLDVNAGRPREVADWLHAGDGAALDARRDRMDHVGPLDDFRKPQGLQPPGSSSSWLTPPAAPGRGNAFVTDMEKSSRSADRSASALFTLPVAPGAPMAPGQTSLTPAPYSPPAKPKPLNVSAPRRNF